MGRVRHPAAIGFYPPSKEALEASLRDCFLDPHGPGHIPKVNPKRLQRIMAGVTPHAGYQYSGPVAAHLFAAIAEDGLPESFILIGPKHGYMRFDGAAIVTAGTWVTPLGECSIDEDLANRILDCGRSSSPPCIVESEEAHEQEHSLEVQLPFIQFLSRQQKIRIVPLVISTQVFRTCQRVGEALAEALKETGRDAVILASTDFTHYGVFYGYAPVGMGPVEKVVRWVHETDGELIRYIEQLDGEGLLKTVVGKRRTMCGSSAVTAMLIAAHQLGAAEGRLLKYATSYDVRGSTDAVVGYAAIIINRG